MGFHTKDVSIIGGSAAGCYTAYLLARQGVKVRLFEAAERIDPTPRSLIVTDYIEDLLGTVAQNAVINKIRRFELFTDGRVATVTLRKPDLVIERKKLIKELSESARAYGAQILTGRRFLGLKTNGSTLRFAVSVSGDTRPAEETAEIVVGADGTFSKVATDVGFRTPPTLPLIQAVVDLPEDLSPDTTRVWFIPNETPYFFWLIPHSASQGVLGLIGAPACDTEVCIERFLEKRGLRGIAFQSALIPDYTEWRPNHRKVGGADVYLVGDAAVHVKVSTVGGVVTGLRGALGTTQAMMNGGVSRELDALRQELNRHRLIRKVLNSFGEADYARLIDLLTPRAIRSLGHFNRDEAHRLLRRVTLEQPRFLLLALKGLLPTSSWPSSAAFRRLISKQN
jgi:flavin-dependent dehydrogenase